MNQKNQKDQKNQEESVKQMNMKNQKNKHFKSKFQLVHKADFPKAKQKTPIMNIE